MAKTPSSRHPQLDWGSLDIEQIQQWTNEGKTADEIRELLEQAQNEIISGTKDIDPWIYAWTDNSWRDQPEWKRDNGTQGRGQLKVGFDGTGYVSKTGLNTYEDTALAIDERQQGKILKRLVDEWLPVNMPDNYEEILSKGYENKVAEHARKPDGTPFTDHSVHKILADYYGATNSGGEWYQTNPEEVIEAINTVKEGKFQGVKADFAMRLEQIECVEKIKSYRYNNPDAKKFLVNAKPRFGKTFTSYELAKETKASRILILSAKTDVLKSWKDDLLGHQDFENWQFFVANDFSAHTLHRPNGHLLSKERRNSTIKFPSSSEEGWRSSDGVVNNAEQSLQSANPNNPVVVFLTIQDFGGVDSNGNIKAKHKVINEQSWDYVFLDEAHFASRTERSLALFKENADIIENVLPEENIDENGKNLDKELDKEHDKLNNATKGLKTDFTVHLSGTPYSIILSGEFEPEAMFNWTYDDEQMAKKRWAEQHKSDGFKRDDTDNSDRILTKSPYAELPEMITFALNPPEEVATLEDYTLSKLFEALRDENDNNRAYFAHKDLVKKWLDQLIGKIDGFSPFANPRFADSLDHIVFSMHQVASCEAMRNLIDDEYCYDGSPFKDYTIIVAAGSNTPDPKTAVRDAINIVGSKTLTITCGKMLTGVTVPRWGALFMLSNTHSAQDYWQAAFRAGSPYCLNSGDGWKQVLKEQCYVFDYAPERTFEIIESKAIAEAKATKDGITGKNVHDFIDKHASNMPTFVISKFGLAEVKATDIVSILAQNVSADTLTRRWQNVPINPAKLDTNPLLRAMILDNTKLSGSAQNNSIWVEAYDDYKDLFSGNDLSNGETKTEIAKTVTERSVQEKAEINNDTILTPTEKTEAKKKVDKKTQAVLDVLEQNVDEADKTLLNKVKHLPTMLMWYVYLSGFEEQNTADIAEHMVDNTPAVPALVAGATRTVAEVQKQRFLDCLGFTHHQFEDILNTGLYDRLALDYEIANFTRVQKISRGQVPDRDFLDVWNKNLSDNEKFSPLERAVIPMLDLLPEEVWTNPNTTFLDPCVKSSRFLLEIERRLMEHGFSKENARSRIFGIATSKIGWLVANKRYYGEPECDGNIIYVEDYIGKIKEIGQEKNEEKRNEKYREFYHNAVPAFIAGSTEEGVSMKFDVIVGNPPYQEMVTGTSATQIYNLFFDAAKSLQPKYLSMIHPARFLFDAGKTPSEWNNKMLNDPHLTVPIYEPNSEKIFPAVDIKGGICVTFWDKDSDSNGLGGAFVPYPELQNVLKKVGTGGFDKIVGNETKIKKWIDSNNRPRTFFPSGAFDKNPEWFIKTPDKTHTVKIIGLEGSNKRTERFVERKLITDPNIEKYKVLLPKSNGSGAIGEVLSTPLVGEPLVGEPLVGCTQTFIQIGSFGPDKPYSEWTSEENANAKQAAENLMKYIKTKFCRALLGTLKITQDNPARVWRNVPLLSFLPARQAGDNSVKNISPSGASTIPQTIISEETSAGAPGQSRQSPSSNDGEAVVNTPNIDWYRIGMRDDGMSELDQQLYDFYSLNETERKFIEDNVREMK